MHPISTAKHYSLPHLIVDQLQKYAVFTMKNSISFHFPKFVSRLYNQYARSSSALWHFQLMTDSALMIAAICRLSPDINTTLAMDILIIVITKDFVDYLLFLTGHHNIWMNGNMIERLQNHSRLVLERMKRKWICVLDHQTLNSTSVLVSTRHWNIFHFTLELTQMKFNLPK